MFDAAEILFERHKSCWKVAVWFKLYPTLSQRCCNVIELNANLPSPPPSPRFSHSYEDINPEINYSQMLHSAKIYQ